MEQNQRNIKAWNFHFPGHGLLAADIKPWGGVLIRWDATANAGAGGWVKGTEVEGERGTICMFEYVNADMISGCSIPDDEELNAAVGQLTPNELYYPAADGDVSTTPAGTPIVTHLGDGIVQFYDAHKPEAVVYRKLRLTANRVVNAGETLVLNGANKGQANATAAFDIHADRNADITLKASQALHDLDDEILITSNRGLFQPDDFGWVDANSFTVPERFDVGDRIDIKQRVA